MNRTDFFESGNRKLSFSCGVPSKNRGENGMLFIHAAHGNRLGPHRMFVEMAQAYRRMGYPTFRFDLSGCGDSTGNPSSSDVTQDICDTINAIRYFLTTEKLKGVFLFAISKGSHIAFNTIGEDKLPVKGMILLSIPVSSPQAALQVFGNYSKEYTIKLLKLRYWLKLLKGGVNIKGVWRTLSNALQLGKRYSPLGDKQVVNRCPILFIYGGNDPIRNNSMTYYTRICTEKGLAYQSHIIEGANHSFFHYLWKEEILRISTEWLAKMRS